MFCILMFIYGIKTMKYFEDKKIMIDLDKQKSQISCVNIAHNSCDKSNLIDEHTIHKIESKNANKNIFSVYDVKLYNSNPEKKTKISFRELENVEMERNEPLALSIKKKENCLQTITSEFPTQFSSNTIDNSISKNLTNKCTRFNINQDDKYEISVKSDSSFEKTENFSANVIVKNEQKSYIQTRNQSNTEGTNECVQQHQNDNYSEKDMKLQKLSYRFKYADSFSTDKLLILENNLKFISEISCFFTLQKPPDIENEHSNILNLCFNLHKFLMEQVDVIDQTLFGAENN